MFLRVEVADGCSHPKFRLKAFIPVAMHLPHMGRKHLFGHRVGLIDKNICLSTFIICVFKNTKLLYSKVVTSAHSHSIG